MSTELALANDETPGELSVIELKSQIHKIQQIMRDAMKENEHYGKIPGTDKPTLLKPGAEKLALVFRLAPSFDIKRSDLPGGHREFEIVCKLTHIPSGRFLAEGVGSCSTLETKYRYRRVEPELTDKPVPKTYWNMRKTNPSAAQELIGGKGYMTKKTENGEWFIANKSIERVENPDIADQYNTVLKMAKKRAQIDATLTATAASDIFTQDIGDNEDETKPAVVKTVREKLRNEILEFCKGNNKKARETLSNLTGGIIDINELTEAQAISHLETFRLTIDDNIPDFDVPPEGDNESQRS